MLTCEHCCPVLVRARHDVPAVIPITVRALPAGHNVGVTTWLLLHGAGSTPRFIERAFAAAAGRAGARLVAPDVSGATMAEMITAIDDFQPGDQDVIGGVSLGAHASAGFAATTGYRGRLYAVMPAWLGKPQDVAALTSATADAVARTSVQEVLSALDAEGDWVVDELRRAWTCTPRDHLVKALRVAARQTAPEPHELTRIAAQTTVVALADDPTHPLTVAQAWAHSVPGADLQVLPRDLHGRAPTELARPLLEWCCAT
jgi:pimeloyl-ACP methyl ester carboxylesterase